MLWNIYYKLSGANALFISCAPFMDYKEEARRILYIVFDPLVHLIHRLGISPNHITLVGLILNILAVLHLLNYLQWETQSYGDNLIGFGFLLGFAGLMDTIDGRLARLFNLHSNFGAYFDSVIDRYSEFIMFIGLLLYFFQFGQFMGIFLSLIALMGSIMVSYNRSRAEAFGVNCSVGLMQRPERIVFIALWTIIVGFLFRNNAAVVSSEVKGIDLLVFGFLFLAVSTNITALRRIFYSQKLLEQSDQ